jgi:hypothetical protein
MQARSSMSEGRTAVNDKILNPAITSNNESNTTRNAWKGYTTLTSKYLSNQSCKSKVATRESLGGALG